MPDQRQELLDTTASNVPRVVVSVPVKHPPTPMQLDARADALAARLVELDTRLAAVERQLSRPPCPCSTRHADGDDHVDDITHGEDF